MRRLGEFECVLPGAARRETEVWMYTPMDFWDTAKESALGGGDQGDDTDCTTIEGTRLIHYANGVLDRLGQGMDHFDYIVLKEANKQPGRHRAVNSVMVPQQATLPRFQIPFVEHRCHQHDNSNKYHQHKRDHRTSARCESAIHHASYSPKRRRNAGCLRLLRNHAIGSSARVRKAT